jgi:PKD repeat protein
MACAIVALAGCGSSSEPPEAAAEGTPVVKVTTTGPNSLRVSWKALEGQGRLRGYQLERRRDFSGPFTAVGDPVGVTGDSVVVLDAGLEPDAWYGYRFRTVKVDGEVSGPSLIGGGRTSPPPGIFVIASTTGVADPDGYTVVIAGPESRSARLGANASQRFAPLGIGEYMVTLGNIASGCTVTGDSARAAHAAVNGAETIDTLRYQVNCRDATRGGVVLLATSAEPVTGTVSFRLEAIIGDSVVVRDGTSAVGQPFALDGLLPGEYTVSLRALPTDCSAAETRRTVQVSALGLDSVTFALECETGGGIPGCAGPTPRDPTKPYALRAEWSAASVAPGSTVDLVLSAEMGSAGTEFGALQYKLEWDPGKLELEAVVAASAELLLSAGPAAGGSRAISVITASQVTGTAPLVRATFRVKADAAAGCVPSRTNLASPGEFVSATFANLVPETQVIEGDLQITPGSGGGGNTPPVARPGGPYSGSVGQAIAFSGAASSDADGSIVTYSWNPGDGGAVLTGVAPGKSYAAAGTYTLTLTVTDNGGATAQATTTVTVSGAGGGGNVSPVARPGGPYTATVGVPVTLNGGGSSDADGSITSYSWSPGDGSAVVSGATPSVTYASAGTYTIALTVVDNLGAGATATTTVTVQPAAGGSGPILRSSFQPGLVPGTIDLIVTLDLTADLAGTPGPEVLASWALSQLSWNERVLKYRSFSTGQWWSAVPVQVGNPDATTGVRTLSVPLSQYVGNGQNSSGVIQLARVSFDVVGAPGTSTTSVTIPAVLLSPGGFSYLQQLQVIEGTYLRP